MITENLSTLKIHNLTKEQYERELAAGRIDESALYLTPYEEVVPTPTSTDNGKFLRVVNGVAAWSTVPNAEEARF